MEEIAMRKTLLRTTIDRKLWNAITMFLWVTKENYGRKLKELRQGTQRTPEG